MTYKIIWGKCDIFVTQVFPSDNIQHSFMSITKVLWFLNCRLISILAVFFVVVATVAEIYVGGPTNSCLSPDSLDGSQDSGSFVQGRAREEDTRAGQRNLCPGPSSGSSPRKRPFLQHRNAATVILHRFSETSVSTSSFPLASRQFSFSKCRICFPFLGRCDAGGRLAEGWLAAVTVGPGCDHSPRIKPLRLKPREQPLSLMLYRNSSLQ